MIGFHIWQRQMKAKIASILNYTKIRGHYNKRMT